MFDAFYGHWVDVSAKDGQWGAVSTSVRSRDALPLRVSGNAVVVCQGMFPTARQRTGDPERGVPDSPEPLARSASAPQRRRSVGVALLRLRLQTREREKQEPPHCTE